MNKQELKDLPLPASFDTKVNLNSSAYVCLTEETELCHNPQGWGYTDTVEQAERVAAALLQAKTKPMGKGTSYVVTVDKYSAIAIAEFLKDRADVLGGQGTDPDTKAYARRLMSASSKVRAKA